MIFSQNLPGSYSAAVLRRPRDLAIQEIPLWPIENYGDEDLVIVEVRAVGVCGSDFRYYQGENPWAQHTLGYFVPNPPNIVLGHEYAGVVVAVQSEANRRLLGNRVAPVCSKTCGACEDCRAGRSRLCPTTVHMGHGQGWGDQPFFPGAYGRFAPAWGASCFAIAEHVSFQEAALLDILAVCVHVSHQGAIQPGRPVLVMGGGPAGNGVAQAAKALGAGRIVILERARKAIDIARTQGVGEVIDTSKFSSADVRDQLKALAPSGFGSVFDTIGTPDSISTGLDSLGKAGTLVNMAVHDEPIPFNFMSLGGERRLVTSCNFEVGDYPIAISWLENGMFRVKDWITRIRLEDLPAKFEEVVSRGGNDYFKLLVDWD